MNEERHTTCVQLPETVWQTLKETADRKGVTVSDLLRDIINIYIFLLATTSPKTDIDALERLVIIAFEMAKASRG